ncbi:serine acetyltransferase [Chryseobacterium indoltheticum]|uniref:Serine acetyltransferase n=2 Tax=Chryseobacterium indoltheticum TaxID=254 RepID=A0A3G6N464_9FLAO|nr:serine acetyltransferase [Chryseobacterium indoltheticum]
MSEPNLIMKSIRLMQFVKNKKIPLLPKMIQWFIRITCSADIPVNISIGKNTVLKHNGLGVVFHEKALIGNNVIIMQHVTLGGRNGRGAPIIGDHVFIGTGACVLGSVSIGKKAMIGANAVVITDVPDNAVVGGIPSRILKYLDEE